MESLTYIIISLLSFFVLILSMIFMMKFCLQRPEQVIYIIDPETLRNQLDDIEFVDEFDDYKETVEENENKEKEEI